MGKARCHFLALRLVQSMLTRHDEPAWLDLAIMCLLTLIGTFLLAIIALS